jgi:acetyl/propionyl-CoA carboxylase alpha subunit
VSDRDPDADQIEVVPLGNRRYLVNTGTARRIAFAVPGRDTWVFLDGHTYLITETDDGSRRRSRADEQDALTAPMPATVLAINVTAGQSVERTQIVMVLEAMKMELPIRSPRDGIVKSIRCQIGDLVQPGATLLELQDEKMEG